ncbi:hypothetical protein LSAT2_028912 [Lamellibrachia satsuma]|nr:hypothetical protein LSAT2_028912 [Lamellibrachia satsuma]
MNHSRLWLMMNGHHQLCTRVTFLQSPVLLYCKPDVVAESDVRMQVPPLAAVPFLVSVLPEPSLKLTKFNPKIVTGLTHRPWVLSRKVDGTEFSGPWHKRLIYPVLDVLLEWSHTVWLWYFCGNSVYLMFQGAVSVRNIAFYKDRDIVPIVWTVNDAHQQEYLRHTLKTSYMTDTMHHEGCEPQKN